MWLFSDLDQLFDKNSLSLSIDFSDYASISNVDEDSIQIDKVFAFDRSMYAIDYGRQK